MNSAFVFPGQGSQTVGMMTSFASLPAVRATFETASAALGFDLWKLVQEGPEVELNQTINTQPAMLVADIALFRAWQALGGELPSAVAGHSLGEYAALVAAGVLDFAETVALVRYRAQLMQEAVPEGTGAMAAILGMEDEEVRAVCRDAAEAGIAEAANYNSPGQVVIAGDTAGVGRAVELAKQRGAKRAVLIAMSVPSHCSLLRPAAERLRDRLAGVIFRAPERIIINNVDAANEKTPERIRDALIRQLSAPVRWVEGMQAIAALGATQVIECGPGTVLTGLNKRSAPTMKAIALKDGDTLQTLAREFSAQVR